MRSVKETNSNSSSKSKQHGSDTTHDNPLPPNDPLLSAVVEDSSEKQKRQHYRESTMAQIHAQAERVRSSFTHPGSADRESNAKDTNSSSAPSDSVIRQGKMPFAAFAPHVSLGMPAFKSSTFLPTNLAEKSSNSYINNQPGQTSNSLSQSVHEGTNVFEAQKRRRGSTNSYEINTVTGLPKFSPYHLQSTNSKSGNADADADAPAYLMPTAMREACTSAITEGLVLNRHPNTEIIVNNNDVLFGHGVKMDSIGNRRLQVLLGLYEQEYAMAETQLAKQRVATTIVGSIRSAKPAGRFIGFDAKSDLWSEVPKESAEAFVHGMLMTRVMSAGQQALAPPRETQRSKQRRQSFVGRSA